MMNENSEEEIIFSVIYTTTYKKELKKYKNQPSKLEKLLDIIEILSKKGTEGVPIDNKPHPLTGNYKACLECHIEPDFLLIWKQYDEEKLIVLERIGSHSELFGKKK